MEVEERRLTLRKSRHRLLSGLLIVVGMVFLAFAVTYFLYIGFARARLVDLQYDTGTKALVKSFTLYPGGFIEPRYWHDPLRARAMPWVQDDLTNGFQPVRGWSIAPKTNRTLPSRIIIPGIGVDSETKELAIVNLGDALAYETPKFIVGHIPDTADPGEEGNGWYFGHLQSPIKGEGAVFRDLPQIATQLREGEDIFVILESPQGDYLYEVTRTEVVHQNNLNLYESEDSIVTLVACVPDFVYDHRLLVTARLVGVKLEDSN